MINLSSEEVAKMREIRIHKILGLPDNGRRIAMPCPIHNGKNNNFNLYRDNSYFCFKCGAKGKGAIDFCQALGYSFIDSLVELTVYL